MESVVLDTPAGIDARLGWDPSVTPHDRKRILTRQIVAARLGVEPSVVRIERESPTTFGHHTRLIASVERAELPLVIGVAEYRAATVVTVHEPSLLVGIDLRDLHPDPETRAVIHAHSKLWEGSTELDFLTHWTRVQAVLAADGRGARVRPEWVRLDQNGTRGSIRDRRANYTLVDLSRNAFVITLAYAPVPED
jgi:4'-phosphopantetheinyl transferase